MSANSSEVRQPVIPFLTLIPLLWMRTGGSEKTVGNTLSGEGGI